MSTARKTAKTKKKKPAGRHRLTAATADIHELYERSVQCAEGSVEILEQIFEDRRGLKPLLLREDFCGTALLCAAWVQQGHERKAIGLDLDGPTLDWGRRRNLLPLGEDANRVTLLQQDVCAPVAPKVDLIAAFNFSYCVFHGRQELLTYFRMARQGLKDGGCLVLDMHGGPDAQFVLEESQDHGDFEYVWSQESFDPISNHTVCKIHFRFPDGTEITDAFTYDWRHWSLPEVKDAMIEAGFEEIRVWWDGPKDMYEPLETAINTESWIAYVAAWK